VFGQGQLNFGALHLYAGLRGDFIRSGESFVSPSAGLAYGRRSLRLHGSVYRGFRAPTLNELYRQFRVGNTLTLANAGLVPEKLFGSEAGVDFVHEKTRLSFTAFRNSLADLITNVTLSETATSITRERENAGAALSRGLEASVDHTWHNWQGQLAYLYADSNYATHFRIPEVPRNQGSATMAYQRQNTYMSLSLRSYSAQFDDDLNQFRLAGFATVQAAARQRLSKNVSAIAEIDNALNKEYYVAFTPTPNIGEPRMWRLGLRWDQK
jgi:outer membrane cobalamin receptor